MLSPLSVDMRFSNVAIVKSGIPGISLSLESLEGSLQKYLERCRIANFSFLGSKEIDISKKFVCE